MKVIILVVSILTISACDFEPRPAAVITDQCIRATIFESCLKQVPRGPAIIGKFNDWSEVVSECADAALYQSYRRREVVKAECAGNK